MPHRSLLVLIIYYLEGRQLSLYVIHLHMWGRTLFLSPQASCHYQRHHHHHHHQRHHRRRRFGVTVTNFNHKKLTLLANKLLQKCILMRNIFGKTSSFLCDFLRQQNNNSYNRIQVRICTLCNLLQCAHWQGKLDINLIIIMYLSINIAILIFPFNDQHNHVHSYDCHDHDQHDHH